MNNPFPQPICEQIWSNKYKLATSNAFIKNDKTVQDTWRRIAKSCAQVEHKVYPGAEEVSHSLVKTQKTEDDFYSILKNFDFLPAGRITAGAGTGRNVTLFNCFVMGVIPDDMGGIFDMLKEAALTMQQGGGIGYDFSPLRPSGSPVKGVDADASGPVSFMNVWDAMCRTIMSAGSRRGAMMATMRCDHPDIVDFIKAKQDAKSLRMFNLSVLISDKFMKAVKENQDWNLIHKIAPVDTSLGRQESTDSTDAPYVYEVIKAKDLWDLIMRSTYDYAEPGVLFIDRINSMNNLNYLENITATNPCVPYTTEILTDKGYQKIGKLVGKNTSVWNGFEFSNVTPALTGVDQDMVTVGLSDGSELKCTKAHKFILQDGSHIQASKLTIGTKLGKSEWPILSGPCKYDIDMYAQGFFSGDGWIKKSSGAQYIGLYGAKKNIPHNWNEKSRHTYKIAGGYSGTDTTQDKDYLYFDKNTFMPKLWVPFNFSIQDKRDWLSGLADSDGTVTKDGSIQISSKEYSFLADVKSLINTMGANCNLQPMKDCWRISISANYVVKLLLNTLRLSQITPSRDARRYLKVVSVVPSGIEDEVYCFTEPKRNSGVFSGVYTAQCGEQPLPPYGACLLGSINLTSMVVNPFTKFCSVDYKKLRKVAKIAVQMLDSVIDGSLFPIPAQELEAKEKRRMGIGITGLADMLYMLNCKYGSDTAVSYAASVMKEITIACYEESIHLARILGPCAATNTLSKRQSFILSGFMKNMPQSIRDKILKYGIRNALLTSVAPTGTISLYAGNLSSGVEPIFATKYTRKVLLNDGVSHREEVVEDYAVKLRRELPCVPEEDEFIVTAQTLTPHDHLVMQSAVQTWVDSSISKTINCPEDILFDDFKAIYMEAWDSNCKGCTTYRPNAVTGSVLSIEAEPKKEDQTGPKIFEYGSTTAPMARPEELSGQTYKLKWNGSNVYITINNYWDADGNQIPFEIFINSKEMAHFQWTVALTRMMSAVFRRGGDVRFVANELKNIFDPNGGQWVKGRYIPSFIALLGQTVELHFNSIGYMKSDEPNESSEPKDTKVGMDSINTKSPTQCLECKGFNITLSGGCPVCLDCGHSKCG